MTAQIGAQTFNISYPSIAVPTVVAVLNCYTIAVEITPSTEDVDVGVFCAPALTDQGRTTYSAVASFLWEPALYTLLLPHVGEQGEARLGVTKGDITQYISFLTRFAAMPWGRFEVGQRVEVELPLAVLSIPVYTDAP